MTEDLLERLERANPVPDDPGAPPLETVLARIEATSRRPGFTPSALRSMLLPALGAVTAIAVVVVALVFAGHGARRSTPASPPANSGGLSGVVSASGAYARPGYEIVSVAQCFPCQTSGPGQVEHYWTLVSHDGGRKWTQATTPGATDVGDVAQSNTQAAQFDPHHDVWALGSRRTRPGQFAFDALVSTDGGLRWSRARIPVPGFAGDLSVARAETWATSGGSCHGKQCAGAEVLRGPSSGSTLRAVPSAPWSASSALQIAAADADTAYVTVTANRQARRTLVTHDAGRTWTQLPSPCMTTAADGLLRTAGDGALWELCPLPGAAGTEIDSTVNGTQWTRGYFPRNWGGVKDIVPVSARAAWAVTDGGLVAVTTDRGFTWRRVWSAGHYRPHARLPIISPQNEVAASIFATQTSGGLTRVVEFRTQDGGRSWAVGHVPVPSQR